ncbi:CAP domain-containing protein [Earliella scabrosa]|nr:CAP domain-containing protein [Earliella scabrosa]
MSRLVYFLFSLPLLLAFITSADAGPACARRNEATDACIELCKQKWGWPGFAMNTDRWGSVVTVTKTNDMGALVTKACRVRPSGALGSFPVPTANTSTASTGDRAIPSDITIPPKNVQVSASVGTISAASSASLVQFASNTTSFSIKLLATSRPVNSTTLSSSRTPNAFVTSTRPSTSSKPTSTSTRSTTTTPKTSTTPRTTTTPKTTTTPPPPPPPTTSTKPKTTTTTTPKPPATTQQPQQPQQGGSGNSGATPQSDIDQYLQAHNSVRSQHGAAALSWSDDLAAKAQEWANNCVFQHSGGKLGKFGENLAAGTGSSYGIIPAVKSWTDEVVDYNPSNPQASHFTQVVWKGTQQVGCAVQSCNGIFAASFGPAKYFVCEYFPQGNIIGAFGENVQK